MRLPFLDSQTGVAQSNCYIWMEKTHRGPGGNLTVGSVMCMKESGGDGFLYVQIESGSFKGQGYAFFRDVRVLN